MSYWVTGMLKAWFEKASSVSFGILSTPDHSLIHLQLEGPPEQLQPIDDQTREDLRFLFQADTIEVHTGRLTRSFQDRRGNQRSIMLGEDCDVLVLCRGEDLVCPGNFWDDVFACATGDDRSRMLQAYLMKG